MSVTPDSLARKRLTDAQSSDRQISQQLAVNSELSKSAFRPTPPPRTEKREYKQAVVEVATVMVGDVMKKAVGTPR